MARDIAAKKVGVFAGVPTMLTALLGHPGIEAHDLSSLKCCGGGGTPLPTALNDRNKTRTGCSGAEDPDAIGARLERTRGEANSGMIQNTVTFVTLR